MTDIKTLGSEVCLDPVQEWLDVQQQVTTALLNKVCEGDKAVYQAVTAITTELDTRLNTLSNTVSDNSAFIETLVNDVSTRALITDLQSLQAQLEATDQSLIQSVLTNLGKIDSLQEQLTLNTEKIGVLEQKQLEDRAEIERAHQRIDDLDLGNFDGTDQVARDAAAAAQDRADSAYELALATQEKFCNQSAGIRAGVADILAAIDAHTCDFTSGSSNTTTSTTTTANGGVGFND